MAPFHSPSPGTSAAFWSEAEIPLFERGLKEASFPLRIPSCGLGHVAMAMPQNEALLGVVQSSVLRPSRFHPKMRIPKGRFLHELARVEVWNRHGILSQSNRSQRLF